MPRYYFDIYDSFASIDDEGVELANNEAAHHQVRITLPALLKDLKTGDDSAHMRVDVRDEAGKRVATGTILMVIEATKVQDKADASGGRTPVKREDELNERSARPETGAR